MPSYGNNFEVSRENSGLHSSLAAKSHILPFILMGLSLNICPQFLGVLYGNCGQVCSQTIVAVGSNGKINWNGL